MSVLSAKPLLNPQGGTDKNSRRMIDGNTTNLSDFNSMKYTWASSQYRQAMNNFWISEEVNLSADLEDHKNLMAPEKTAYDRILSLLVPLDSIRIANLPCIAQYITANEVNLCLTVQGFQEVTHNQSYNYMLDSICSPVGRDRILYQRKGDEHLLHRNTFIRNPYNEFQERRDDVTLLGAIMVNYILEGIHLYSGSTFFYNLGRGSKTSGNVQEIRYINRNKNTRLWLFRSTIGELRREEPQLFAPEMVGTLKSMLEGGMAQEVQWGSYVIGDGIPGLTSEMVTDYIRYLGNLHWSRLGFDALYEGYDEGPEPVKWVNQYSNTDTVKTDFFEAKGTTYAKGAAIVDDLQVQEYNEAGTPA